MLIVIVRRKKEKRKKRKSKNYYLDNIVLGARGGQDGKTEHSAVLQKLRILSDGKRGGKYHVVEQKWIEIDNGKCEMQI